MSLPPFDDPLHFMGGHRRARGKRIASNRMGDRTGQSNRRAAGRGPGWEELHVTIGDRRQKDAAAFLEGSLAIGRRNLLAACTIGAMPGTVPPGRTVAWYVGPPGQRTDPATTRAVEIMQSRYGVRVHRTHHPAGADLLSLSRAEAAAFARLRVEAVAWGDGFLLPLGPRGRHLARLMTAASESRSRLTGIVLTREDARQNKALKQMG